MNLNWGAEVWERKINDQDAVGVILGTGKTQKDLDRNTRRLLGLLERTLLQHVKPPARLLDVGTGPAARFAIALADRGYRMTGLDGSPTTLELARRAAGARPIEFVRGAFEDFSLKQRFDGLLCLESFFHLPAHLSLRGLTCFNHALEPGGFALIQFGIQNEMTLSFLLYNLFYRLAFVIARPILRLFGRKSYYVMVARISDAEAFDLARLTGFEVVDHQGEFYLLRKTHEA